ncbi:MAG: UvrB/UvrC motif-containing protein [Bacillota bacterium]
MFCDQCKMRPASVYITKILNNEKSQLNLCEECAKEYQQNLGFNLAPSFSIHKFLTGLLEGGEALDQQLGRGLEYLKCKACEADYGQFQQTGRLGCADCYDAFSGKLDLLLKRVHGSSVHSGKFPKRAGSHIRISQQIRTLKNKLHALVAAEEFEKAAEVRDKIRDLEKSLEGKGGS